MAKRGWRPYLVFALFTCRSFLAVCLCTIPAAKALLVFGAGSRKSSLHRSLASAGKTRCHSDWSSYPHLSKTLDRAYVPRHVLLCSLFAYCSKLRATCKSASRHVKQEVETSCREVHLRKASYAVILSLGRINSLQLLAARTQAVEPILLKSVGKASATMLASRKQQSGKHRFGCAASGSGIYLN